MKKQSEEVEQPEKTAQDQEENGKMEKSTLLEPFPAVLEENTQVEPERQSLAAKKALFDGNLIEVKSVSPVAAPRKSRKEASGAVETAAENKDDTAAGVCDEATPSASTDFAAMPHKSEATPPHPEATPSQPETTPPEHETMPPVSEEAAQPGSFTKQEEPDSPSSLHAPPRRKRASKFIGNDMKDAPTSSSPPSQKNEEWGKEKKESHDVKKDSATEQSTIVGESDGAQRGETGSYVQQHNMEEVDTGEVHKAGTEELLWRAVEGGSTAVEGGEGVSEPSDSLQPTVLDVKEVWIEVKEPATQQGVGGAEEGEGQTLVEAKLPQENRK